MTPPVQYASKISQYGITWYFGSQYPSGQFVNGDYWVTPLEGEDSVSIIFIDPPSQEINGRVKNGSMINPDPNIGNKGYHMAAQGYDSHMWVDSENHYYPELNAALDVSPEKPLSLKTGSSLVSCTSLPEPHVRPQLKTAAVLTVLAQAPSHNDCFRPPYSGTDKNLCYRYSDIEPYMTGLKSLDLTGISVPSASEAAAWINRPWIDHIPGHLAGHSHPADNMPQYGFDLANRVSEISLWLHLNIPEKDKLPVLIGFIQYGIDLYSIALNGYTDDGIVRQWSANGGHCAGRKWPILFAGIMLGNQDMIEMVSDTAHYDFQEDSQVFTVDDGIIDYTSYPTDRCGNSGENKACGRYTDIMTGMPEWGIGNRIVPDRNAALWKTMYRQCCTARGWGGFALAMHIMSVTDLWGKDAFFRYVDRFIEYEKTYSGDTPSAWQDSALVRSMWDRYRMDYMDGISYSEGMYAEYNLEVSMIQ